MRKTILFVLFAVPLVLAGCGSNGNNSTSGGGPVPIKIQGKWQFVGSDSRFPGAEYELFEVSLSQADTHFFAPSSSTLWISVGKDTNGWHIGTVGGVCSIGPLALSLDGSIVSNTQLTATFSQSNSQGSVAIKITGTISADGKAVPSGNYSLSCNGGAFTNLGTVTGTLVPNLTGNYSGTHGPSSPFTATVVEDSSRNLTIVTMQNGTQTTLTGEAIGGGFLLNPPASGSTPASFGFEIPTELQGQVLVGGTNPVKAGDFYITSSQIGTGIMTKQ